MDSLIRFPSQVRYIYEIPRYLTFRADVVGLSGKAVSAFHAFLSEVLFYTAMD